jgi:muramidase (phage lysozyme)
VVQLPNEDAIAPLPDHLPRRTGVGGWQPDIISRDTSQFGQGLERLGGDLGVAATIDENKQNQLALAQANSSVQVAAIQHGEMLKSTTDGSQTGDINDSFNTAVNNIANSLPEGQQPLFRAQHAPTVAQFGENADMRAKELDGQQAVANFGASKAATINAAAGIDNDAASGAAISTIGPHIDALQGAGYVNAEQAQQMKQQAVRDYATARYSIIKQQAESTGDWTRLQRFIESDPFQGADNSQPQQPGQGPVNMAIPPEGRALLATIRGPESGKNGYNSRYTPQGNGTFQGFDDHPRQAEVIPHGQPNAGNTSDAAGNYQFLSSTWDNQAKKLGLANFSPANQDAAAWDLAQTTYKQQTGNDLLTALKSNDPKVLAGVSDALKGQWSSLPGGVQPGTTTSKFVNQFQNNLQTTATQHGGGAFVGLPPPNQVAGPGAPSSPSGVDDSQHFSWNEKTGKFDIPIGGGQPVAPGVVPPPVYDSKGNPVPQQEQAVGPGGAPATPPNLSLVPDKSKWPDGTDHVAANKDGTLSYVATDGTTTPVPGSRPTGAPGLPAPQRPGGSVLDFLDPQEHARILLEAQQTINSLQRQQYQAQKQVSAQQGKQIDGTISAITAGNPVPDASFDQMRRVYTSPGVDPEIAAKFAAADAIRNNIKSYQGVPPAQVAADVANKQADFTRSVQQDPNNPFNDIKSAVLTASQQYLKNYQTEVAKDPLSRAAKDGILPNGIQPIDPKDPNIVATMQQRVADAQHVAAFYGQTTPKYLLPQERIALKQISAAGGQGMVDLAGNVVAGAGNNAGQIFKEIGGDAPAFTSVGALKVLGGDPGAIDDIAKYTAAEHDPNAKRDLPRFNETFLKKHGLDDSLGDSYTAFGPDADGRTRAAANILMGARAMREGTDPAIDPTKFDQPFVDKAYNQALGATYDADGNQFGGVANHGGGWFANASAEKVLAPSNMKASEFTHAIDSITDNDIRSLPRQPFLVGGTPLTAQQVKTGHLLAVPDQADGLFHGRYTMTMGDPNAPDAKPVVGQDGKPWVLDLNRLEPSIKSRLPGIYLDKGPTPSVPPPQPYKGTPGMMSADALENEPVTE